MSRHSPVCFANYLEMIFLFGLDDSRCETSTASELEAQLLKLRVKLPGSNWSK